jgi:hypothetical protein
LKYRGTAGKPGGKLRKQTSTSALEETCLLAQFSDQSSTTGCGDLLNCAANLTLTVPCLRFCNSPTNLPPQVAGKFLELRLKDLTKIEDW